MKKLIAAAFVAATVVAPVAPAHADDTGPIVRTEECPPGRVGRTIHIGDNISVYNCYPVPGRTSEGAAIVRLADCPPGYTGYVVQAWNEKRGWYDLVVFCIPFGP
ncbi:MAG TPA: hypothetical protein VEV43_14175 [Actinomycetota bacterium]|nr:hypothetical protein [Actinomycetota bacterium]